MLLKKEARYVNKKLNIVNVITGIFAVLFSLLGAGFGIYAIVSADGLLDYIKKSYTSKILYGGISGLLLIIFILIMAVVTRRKK